VLFAVRLRDVDCWFLLARKSIFRRIPIQSNGRFAHAEILAKANFLGHLMTEAPVTYHPSNQDPAKATEPSNRLSFAELYRVLSHPDFGPAVVPDDRVSD